MVEADIVTTGVFGYAEQQAKNSRITINGRQLPFSNETSQQILGYAYDAIFDAIRGKVSPEKIPLLNEEFLWDLDIKITNNKVYEKK